MRNIVLAATVALALTSAAVAQKLELKPEPLPEPTVVKVAISSKLTAFAPLLVGNALGEFEKENIKIEYVIAKTTDGLALLATDRVDVMSHQPSAAFYNAVAGGSDIRIVTPGTFQNPDSKQGLWVNKAFLNGQPYSTEKLKGQTIGSAVGLGSATTVYIQDELAKANLSLKDVTLKQMGSADILIALENGSINFGILNDPVWLSADTEKVAFVTTASPDLMISSWLYGPNLLRNKPEVGHAFMRAFARTVRDHLQGNYYNDPETGPALAAELEQSLENLQKLPPQPFPADLKIREDTMRSTQATYLTTPEILTFSSPLPMEDVIDNRFLEALK